MNSHKNDDERLQASERRFEATFEQAAVGMALVAPGGRWLRVNRKLCGIVGYTPEELLTRAFQDITYPDDLDKDLDQMSRMLAREIDTYSLEKRYLRKDGSIVWINLTVALVWKPDGTPDYFISVVEDISARKSAAAALRDALSFNETALRCLGEGLYTIDTQGLVTSMNPAAENLFGWSFAELRGRKMHDMTHHHYRDGRPFPSSECAGFQVLTTGKPLNNHADVFIRKDGSFFDVNYTIAPLRDESGVINGLVVVFRDDTVRKTAEVALHEARRLAGLGHWHWDLRTDVHVWSEEIYACYGRDPSLPPAVYPEVQQYFTPESWASLAAAVEQGMNTGKPYECDAEVVRPDGTHRWITARGQASRDADGKLIALYGTVQDITARKQAEMELRRRNEELERFDRAATGRELLMIALKREANALAQELGREPPYDLSFANEIEDRKP